MNLLVDFYRYEDNFVHPKYTLLQILLFDKNQFEINHDFIQWLFPLKEESKFNINCPILKDCDIIEFKNDISLQSKLNRSFEYFCKMIGLDFIVNDNKKFICLRNFSCFDKPNHNWLRITRTLTSMRLLGQEENSNLLFSFLKKIENYGCDFGLSMEYWQNSQNLDFTFAQN